MIVTDWTMPDHRWVFRCRPQVVVLPDGTVDVRDVDSDTLRFQFLDQGLGDWKTRGDRGLRIRLLGLDGPERGEPGRAAADAFTASWMQEAHETGLEWPLLIETYKPDPSDGLDRWLAVVWMVATGRCLNRELLDAGLEGVVERWEW